MTDRLGAANHACGLFGLRLWAEVDGRRLELTRRLTPAQLIYLAADATRASAELVRGGVGLHETPDNWP